MAEFDKLKLKKRVQDDPQRKIRELQGQATNAVKRLIGAEMPIEGESMREPRMLIGPDVEARPGFKADQERLFKDYADRYEAAGIPMVKEEMTPMEEAEMKRQQLEEFMKRQNKGPRGL